MDTGSCRLAYSLDIHQLRHIVVNQRMDAVHGLSSGRHQPFKVVPESEARHVLQHFQCDPLYRRIPLVHQFGFLVAAIAGVIGSLIILFFVSDTPESKGLPSVQALSGETLTKEDTMPTKELQKVVLKHPGIWVIAISSAFIYITKYAISGWGVLFLQKAHGFSLEDATQIIAFSAAF